MRFEHLFSSVISTPLGQFHIGALFYDGPGVVEKPMRVLGRYSLTYLFDGGGAYRDVQGFKQRLQPGDAILVFPELAHWFGPERGDTWDEIHLVFDGPLFDLLGEQGVLNPAQPVFRCGAVEQWLPKIRSAISLPRPKTVEAAMQELLGFAELLVEITGQQPVEPSSGKESQWLQAACYMLGSNLNMPLRMKDVANAVGLSYESFRKNFQKQMGTSPARYRAEKRANAAEVLLQHTPLSNKEIARDLGFSNPFHFSSHFKRHAGVSPRKARLQSQQPEVPEANENEP